MDNVEFKAKLYKAITAFEDALKNDTEVDPSIMKELTSSIENILEDPEKFFLENSETFKQRDFELIMMMIHLRNISKKYFGKHMIIEEGDIKKFIQYKNELLSQIGNINDILDRGDSDENKIEDIIEVVSAYLTMITQIINWKKKIEVDNIKSETAHLILDQSILMLNDWVTHKSQIQELAKKVNHIESYNHMSDMIDVASIELKEVMKDLQGRL